MPEWSHTRDGRLIETFLLFVGLQLIFAVIYFMIYHRNRANFAFNTDILRKQSESRQVLLEQSANRLRRIRDAIIELETLLRAGEQPEALPARTSVRLSSGDICTMHYYSYAPAGSVFPLFEVTDGKDERLFAFNSHGSYSEWTGTDRPGTTLEWLESLPGVLNYLTKQQASIARRIDSLSTSTPDVWSYLDFLYFSIIAQTTVGFGDILPNSTLTRMVVAAQILIGYALLVVVLNVVLGS
jgi:hypothetical protein